MAAFQSLRPDGRLRCRICPHGCALADGEVGRCRVRRRRGGVIVGTSDGLCSGLQVDPIEKKPFHHVLPGARTLSYGTVGCNLACRFCQNWHLSHAVAEAATEPAMPVAIVAAAVRHRCTAIAATYNDPVVFLDYALAVARAARERGLRSLAVTAGYVHGAAGAALAEAMDAANVDLKAFDDGFYRRFCGARLRPVLDALRGFRRRGCWLEVTTLLIPGLNDGDAQVAAAAHWLREELGPEQPWHLSAFHPAGALHDLPPTPPATLRRAREIARAEGLAFVYLGNLADGEGGDTACPGCGRMLIERRGFAVLRNDLAADGRCPGCGRAIPGIWA